MDNTRQSRTKTKEKNYSSNKLMLLITIINRRKAEFYTDLIQNLGANMQFTALGEGTADARMLSRLGLSDSDKTVIFSVIRESDEKKILGVIDQKFGSIKDGKGISFTVPFSSVIGASVFNFLSNNRSVFN